MNQYNIIYNIPVSWGKCTENLNQLASSSNSIVPNSNLLSKDHETDFAVLVLRNSFE